jgi:phosphoglycolate phosphatase-like HAD superfamily hydrolase
MTAAASPRDGVAFVKRALADIQQRVARGEKVRVAFDIDDTLVETRSRTLAIAKEWDAANGTHYFDRLTLPQVAHTGFDTAAALGLPGPAEKAFAAFWDEKFWDGAHFRLDTPIAPMVELAKQARAAGAEVIYLTGRNEDLAAATVAELEGLGLPQSDAAHVVTRTDPSVPTPTFKAAWLAKSAQEGHPLAFFATESRRDISGVQRALPDCPCLMLDSTFSGTEAIDPSTPVLPRVGV